MANSALKITAFMIIISGLISAFGSLGIANATSVNQYNLNEQKWHEVTNNDNGVSNSNGLQSATETYTVSTFSITDLVIGTVYVKGVIDNWCNNNPVIELFTSIMQAVIYFVAIIGCVGWILNKFNIL